MSVNRSARALLAADHDTVIHTLLGKYDVPAEALIIEMTEHVHLADPQRCSAVLANHRARGSAVALDDFGTGYSALAYLAQLPLDIIKIPIQLTGMLNGQHRQDALARAVFHLGRSLGLTTVAEGVETVEQWKALQAIGCDRAQGYYFDRPLPAEIITERLSNTGEVSAIDSEDVLQAGR